MSPFTTHLVGQRVAPVGCTLHTAPSEPWGSKVALHDLAFGFDAVDGYSKVRANSTEIRTELAELLQSINKQKIKSLITCALSSDRKELGRVGRSGSGPRERLAAPVAEIRDVTFSRSSSCRSGTDEPPPRRRRREHCAGENDVGAEPGCACWLRADSVRCPLKGTKSFQDGDGIRFLSLS